MSSSSSGGTFDFTTLISAFNNFASYVDSAIASIGGMSPSKVNMGTMFTLQMDMNQFSMFSETLSNVMAGINAVGMTVSRNVKTS